MCSTGTYSRFSSSASLLACVRDAGPPITTAPMPSSELRSAALDGFRHPLADGKGLDGSPNYAAAWNELRRGS